MFTATQAPDADAEADVLYEKANLDPRRPPGPMSLSARLHGLTRAPRVLISRQVSRAAICDGRSGVILVQERLGWRARNYVIAHEIAEWHLNEAGYRQPDREALCDAIAARLLVPRQGFRRACLAAGGNLETLAARYKTTQTIIALRRGEVLGTPVAVVDAKQNWHAVRGDPWAWGGAQNLRRLASGEVSVPEVERLPLTDAPRVLLMAAV